MNIVFYGDSNTYGYNPIGDRYTDRFTNILKNKYLGKHNIYNEGLVGRTTIYDDIRPNRKAINDIEKIINKYDKIDLLVIMLGTNDYKKNNARSLKDLEISMNSFLNKISNIKNIILISPIHLSNNISNLDLEYDDLSYELSVNAKKVYKKIANENNYLFLDASLYASHGIDGEHIDLYGHKNIAEAIYNLIELSFN